MSAIITISHEAFGEGRVVAERVAAILGYRCISKEVLTTASQRYGISETKLVEVLEERPHSWWKQWLESRGIYRIALQAAVCELAQEGNIVYHGRAGQEFFPASAHVLNVFLDIPTSQGSNKSWRAKGSLRKLRKNISKNWIASAPGAPGNYSRSIGAIRHATTSCSTPPRLPWKRRRARSPRFLNEKEYQPTAESIQAMKDLTVTARAEAVLIASHLEISNLEVATQCGEVHIGGVILAESITQLAADKIRKIPGVVRVVTLS